MTKPIRPQDVVPQGIPDEVIDVFNELIQMDFRNGQATVMQKEAAKMSAERMNISVEEVFEKHYLDVEEVFREVGWKVEYHKAVFNETYFPEYFVFKG